MKPVCTGEGMDCKEQMQREWWKLQPCCWDPFCVCLAILMTSRTWNPWKVRISSIRVSWTSQRPVPPNVTLDRALHRWHKECACPLLLVILRFYALCWGFRAMSLSLRAVSMSFWPVGLDSTSKQGACVLFAACWDSSRTLNKSQ